jgi:hypothetical protein
VAIVGTSLQAVDLDIDYRHLAVACRTVLDETSVVVYGSVLPWLSARTHAPDVYGDLPRPFIEIFATVLGEQVEDMRELRLRYPDEALVWAGDFNHTLMGRALQREASAMLQRAVEDLGLKVTNAAAPHRTAPPSGDQSVRPDLHPRIMDVYSRRNWLPTPRGSCTI